ncbi:EF-hand domain-containing protein [Pontiella sulfatireligans]|uniref:EF-hand domain-containing protein n=1 Tax=Pontiella sulfatireligans TaxID=2750658 RepID=A0A6C2UHJ7_9BACT|nr:EF-hand domain-containing protein [Pontiella sulfatireligans]VGO19333.1 hypothetical protein SCARR_01391 [Pontiella sulfatireligans]
MKRWIIVLLCGMLISSVQAAEQAFRNIDTDKDGRISKAEYTESIRQRFEKQGKEGYKKEADNQFKRKDKNKDGYLDEEEFSIRVKRKK